MAEQKDDPNQVVKPGQSKRTASMSGATDQGAPHERPPSDRVAGEDRSGASTGAAEKTSATVVRRKQRYLIGFRALAGIAVQPSDPFLERLAQLEGVEIIRRLRARGSPVPKGSQMAVMAPPNSLQEILVVRMDEQRGEALRQNAPPARGGRTRCNLELLAYRGAGTRQLAACGSRDAISSSAPRDPCAGSRRRRSAARECSGQSLWDGLCRASHYRLFGAGESAKR